MAIRRYDIGGPEDGPLHVGEGRDWEVDVDLTSWAGWTPFATIKYLRGAANPPLIELACSKIEPDGDDPAMVRVSLDGDQTSTIGAFTAYWDLVVRPDAAPTNLRYIAEGTVTVTDRVTIPA